MRWCILVRVRASLAMAGISEARLFFYNDRILFEAGGKQGIIRYEQCLSFLRG